MKHLLIHDAGKQSGYGLLEVVVALALTAILGTGISIFTVQTLTQSDRSSYQMQAVQQLEIAGYWVGRDVQMSQTVTPGPNAGFPLTVNWTDENENEFQVTFSINGNQLQRTMVENGGPSRNTLLVYSINPSPTLTNCSYANALLTFNATATFYNWSLSRTFLINKRPW